MKVTKTNLAKNSILYKDIETYHYIDSYEANIPDNVKDISSADLARAFLSSGPKWVESLFNLRNKIVGVLGLKTSGDSKNQEEILRNSNFEIGEQLGLFKVFAKNDSEIILGEDDRHLDFRISLFAKNSNPRKLSISTTVIFNNWFGKLYFLPVKIFHKSIVPIMLKGTINNLDKK